MSADLSSGPNLMYPAPENGNAHLTSSSSVPNQRRQSINPNLPTMGKGHKSQYGMSIIARNLPEGGNLTLDCQVIALHPGRKKRYFMITLERGVKGQKKDELAKVYLEGNPHFQTAVHGNSNNEYVGHEKEFNRKLLTALSRRIRQCACKQEWNLWLEKKKTLVHSKVVLRHTKGRPDMKTDGFQIFTRDQVPQPPLDENGNVAELDENGNVKEPELDENGNIKVGVVNNGVPCSVRREEEARARQAATPPEAKKRHRYFKDGATETKKSRKSVQRVPSPPPKTSKKLEKAAKRNSPKNLQRNRQRG